MIVVATYDPEWPRRSEDEREILERALAAWLEGRITTSDRLQSPETRARLRAPSHRVREDMWRERLVFRDALRADPALAAEYAFLKLELAFRHGEDLPSYTAGKRGFVTRALAERGLRPGGHRPVVARWW